MGKLEVPATFTMDGVPLAVRYQQLFRRAEAVEAQQKKQLVIGDVKIGVERNRAAKLLGRLFLQARALLVHAEIVVGLGVVGGERYGFSVGRDGVVIALHGAVN